MIYIRLILAFAFFSLTASANDQQAIDSVLLEEGVAMFHIYRGKGSTAVTYDLQLSNRTLCRVAENSKKSIKVSKLGNHNLWARIKNTQELAITVEAGKHYYIQCGVGRGSSSGYPTLRIDTHEDAAYEYMIFNQTCTEDKILLNNGDIVNCFITSEDINKIYFVILLNGEKVKTSIDRSRIIDTKKGSRVEYR